MTVGVGLSIDQPLVTRCMLKSAVNWMKFVSALATALVLLVAVRTDAQSLGGSPSSMNRQHRQARTHDFTFMESATRIKRFVAANLIVPLEGNSDYLLHEVSYPYARPAVQLFIERLSRQFRSACGETLAVTSLTRPVDEQPGNAHDRSVHPTGMAVDLRGAPHSAVPRLAEPGAALPGGRRRVGSHAGTEPTALSRGGISHSV